MISLDTTARATGGALPTILERAGHAALCLVAALLMAAVAPSLAWAGGPDGLTSPADVAASAHERGFRVQLSLPEAAPQAIAAQSSTGTLAAGDIVTVPATMFGLSGDAFYQAEVIEAMEVEGGAITVAQAPRRPPSGRTTVAEGGDPERIQVELVVIHATNDKKTFDPRIARFKKQLSFLSYTGFDLLSQERFTLNMGQTQQTSLSEGNIVETTLVSGTAAKVHLRMRLIKPAPQEDVLLDTTVTIPRKGTFFVGGPKYKRGVLVMPVTANY